MSARLRLFTAMVRLAEWCEKAARGFLFLGAGVLRRSDLAEVARRSWSDYHPTDTEVRSGLTNWEQATYLPFVASGGRVCVVGCGSGRLVLAFATAGHEVVGIEPSPKPVARLRQTLDQVGLRASVIESEIERVELPGLFDLVLFSEYCYGAIQGSGRRVAVLEEIARHLVPDGRVLFTYPSRRGNWDGRSRRLANLAARVTRSDWRLEPYDALHRVDVAGEPGAVLCYHFFVREDIEREATAAGLRVLVHGEPFAQAYAVLGR